MPTELKLQIFLDAFGIPWVAVTDVLRQL
jgi:hypothetical protein